MPGTALTPLYCPSLTFHLVLLPFLSSLLSPFCKGADKPLLVCLKGEVNRARRAAQCIRNLCAFNDRMARALAFVREGAVPVLCALLQSGAVVRGEGGKRRNGNVSMSGPHAMIFCCYEIDSVCIVVGGGEVERGSAQRSFPFSLLSSFAHHSPFALSAPSFYFILTPHR